MPGCPAKPNVSGTTTLSGTITVPASTTFVGNGTRYTLGGGSQAEGQPPLWNLEDGATIRDVVIGTGASDGVHCLGSCLIDNVWWEDVGEDAATALGVAGTTFHVNCGATFLGVDKIFQHNGRGQVIITNFKGNTAGKLYRSCGDCTGNGGPRVSSIDNVRLNNVPTVVGINENFGDRTTIRRLTVSNTDPSNNDNTSTKVKVCQTYIGVVKGSGSTSATGVKWITETSQCDVQPSDVTVVLNGGTQLNTSEYTGTAQPNIMTE